MSSEDSEESFKNKFPGKIEDKVANKSTDKFKGESKDEFSNKSLDDTYYELNPAHTDPRRIKKERENAQKLKKSRWWLDQLNRGICHYCEKKYPAGELTMDHVVPLARGGQSNKGNVVPSCRNCNQKKRLHTPVDLILRGK